MGQLLDRRYEITAVLAKGGFGQTYLARDTRRPGHPVCVVKQLIATIATAKPETLNVIHRLFNSEAEVLERLGKHDQIPQLLAHFDEDQEFYLVQEYISGHALTDELFPGQVWSEAKVIEFLSGILNVLGFVHQQGVIHRDIKPANIIRREPDNKLVLIDFGAVKELKTSINLNNQTIEIGTPGYIPIEQLRGYPQFNSDIYSVGVIAIQAATGLGVNDLASLLDPNSPYKGDREWRSYAQISPDLIKLLEKMTCSNYQERYQSATEALTDLDRLINSKKNIVPDTVIGSRTQPPASQSVVPPTLLSPSSPEAFNQSVPQTATGSTTSQPTVPIVQAPVQATVQTSSNPSPKQGLPLLVKVLIWVGGGAVALIAVVFGLFILRYSSLSTSSDSSPSATPASPTVSPLVEPSSVEPSSTAASPYFEYLRVCEGKGERPCAIDNALFDEAAVSMLQVDAITKNLKKGDKISVVIKFNSPAGSTEKPYPVPYEVQGFEGERVFAVVGRSKDGWNLGTYTFEFRVEGKTGAPGQKTFAILKSGKAER